MVLRATPASRVTESKLIAAGLSAIRRCAVIALRAESGWCACGRPRPGVGSCQTASAPPVEIAWCMVCLDAVDHSVEVCQA